jgi:hypothetical protein
MGATNAAAPPRAAPSSKPYRPASDRHGHLWQLPDGTGLHAPLGTLVRSEDGQLVCCHLCGRWFEHLGAHVRVHGYTAASYKDTFGLLRTKGMVGTELSAAIAARQRDSYTASAEVRQRFESGHEMARSGQLSWLARRAEMSTQGRRAAAERLSVLRVSRAARRDAALAAVIAETGAADLHAYLRGQYAAGASLDALVRSTGLARAALRAEVAAAGIEVRKAGLNTGAGKQSRALTADAAAAAHVGTTDIRLWLTAQRADGVSLNRLAEAVSRSVPWVRSRLAGQVSCGRGCGVQRSAERSGVATSAGSDNHLASRVG